jgi:hypothetical protein
VRSLIAVLCGDGSVDGSYPAGVISNAGEISQNLPGASLGAISNP